MQRDRHVNNHEAAIFLRTTALEHGWLNELLKMGERGVHRSPQFEVIIHKYLVKLLPKLYQQGKYEQYTRRGATKNHGYYTDLKNAVNYEKARLGTKGFG